MTCCCSHIKYVHGRQSQLLVIKLPPLYTTRVASYLHYATTFNSSCRSSPPASKAAQKRASPKTAVRHISPNLSMASPCSTHPHPSPRDRSLTLTQTFALYANRRATSTPTCASWSIQNATIRCARPASIGYSHMGLRRVQSRGARGRSGRRGFGVRRLRISRWKER